MLKGNESPTGPRLAYLSVSLHLVVLCLKLLYCNVNWVHPVLWELITVICLWHLSRRTVVLHDRVTKTGRVSMSCSCLFFIKKKKSYLFLDLVNYHSEVIQKELFNFAKQEVVDWVSVDPYWDLYLFVRDLKKRTAVQELDDDILSKVSQEQSGWRQNDGKPNLV